MYLYLYIAQYLVHAYVDYVSREVSVLTRLHEDRSAS